MNRLRNSLVLLTSFLLLVACASTNVEVPANSHQVKLEQDLLVSTYSGETKKVLKGEMISIVEPTMLESEGHVGVLVMPPSVESNYTVKLKPISEWGGVSFQKELGRQLSELTAEINDVQISMGNSDYSGALLKIDKLKQKYPFVGYLRVLESSCYLARGDRAKAESLLKDGLANISETVSSEEMKRYINSIEGKQK